MGDESSPLQARRIPGIVKEWAGVLALIGILIYGVGRVTLDAFYGSFHVATDEVGLGYARVLSSSFVLVVVILTMGSFFVFIWGSTLSSDFLEDLTGFRMSNWRDFGAWIIVNLITLGFIYLVIRYTGLLRVVFPYLQRSKCRGPFNPVCFIWPR